MVHDWKNKVVLITGGANGIGAAVVKTLMDEGVKHIAMLDVAETQGLALQEELNSKYAKTIVRFIKCDVGVEDQLSAAFKTTVDQCGYIDVVVNNAGICNDTLEKFRKEIEVNYIGLVSSSLKAMQLMRKDEGGRGGTIVNVASIAALLQIPYCPIYSGTKSAVLQFSLSIGMDAYYLRTNVRVITVCFGATTSEISKRENAGTFDKEMDNQFFESVASYEWQPPEKAARGLIDAYKNGENASTWVVNESRPAKDITAAVTKAYAILAEQI